MKVTSILSAMLLSVTAASLVACNDSKSSQAPAAAATTQAAVQQKSVLELKKDAAVESIEGLKAERGKIQTQQIETQEIVADAKNTLKNAEAKKDELIDSAFFGTHFQSDSLKKSLKDVSKDITNAKNELAEVNKIAGEENQEIQAINQKIKTIETSVQIIDLRIGVEKHQSYLSAGLSAGAEDKVRDTISSKMDEIKKLEDVLATSL